MAFVNAKIAKETTKSKLDDIAAVIENEVAEAISTAIAAGHYRTSYTWPPKIEYPVRRKVIDGLKAAGYTVTVFNSQRDGDNISIIWENAE
ncbi:hypothetical protein KAMAJI_01500 [Serratia phage vB_SmaM-Kamaji]|nr:hypothetical protein KAMAJI_01500 [Serratia phage vB_SmaM-Kamaji]